MRWTLAVIVVMATWMITQAVIASRAMDDRVLIVGVGSLMCLIGAFAIAGILLAPAIVVRSLRDGRATPAPRTASLGALLLAGLAMCPVQRDYTHTSRSVNGLEIHQSCEGLAALADAVGHRLAHDDHALLVLQTGCDDDG